jgi:hypothetical protein
MERRWKHRGYPGATGEGERAGCEVERGNRGTAGTRGVGSGDIGATEVGGGERRGFLVAAASG